MPFTKRTSDSESEPYRYGWDIGTPQLIPPGVAGVVAPLGKQRVFYQLAGDEEGRLLAGGAGDVDGLHDLERQGNALNFGALAGPNELGALDTPFTVRAGVRHQVSSRLPPASSMRF